MKKTDPKVFVQSMLNANVNLVWRVITELHHLQNWFFNEITEFKPIVGFETSFIINSGGNAFDHRWKIIEVELYKTITYNWRYKGYSGDSLVQFKLIPKGHQTVIQLTTEILEDFPQNIPEFKIESCVGGWNYFIKERLPEYINSTTK